MADEHTQRRERFEFVGIRSFDQSEPIQMRRGREGKAGPRLENPGPHHEVARPATRFFLN